MIESNDGDARRLELADAGVARVRRNPTLGGRVGTVRRISLCAVEGWFEVDGADGRRPPWLPACPSATSFRMILLMLDFTISASGRTNRCPGKSGAAQSLQEDAGDIEESVGDATSGATVGVAALA